MVVIMRLSSSMARSLLASLVAVLLSSCGDVWMSEILLEVDCSDPQCGWQVERGGVERTASWHPKDYAFSLTSNDSSISRTLPVQRNAKCLRFSYIGQIEPSASVQVELDFNDDGRSDASTELPSVKWKRQNVYLSAPADYRRLRLRMRKTGDGDAKLARFGVVGEYGECPALPPTTLQDGAECGSDATCASNRCYLGHCSACGAGGCAEGEACRNESDCLDGACAAGVCRACAKSGSCGTSEGCSTAGQCASNSCVSGSVPSLMSQQPQYDATCGNCDAASDCASGHCVFGRCSECATDADCSDGLACLYIDRFDALERRCAPRLTSPLPRGALCENDTQCEGALPCGGGDGRAKRCGFSCGKDGDCAAGQVCIAPGARRVGAAPELYVTMPRWKELSGRIATCWPVARDDQPCELHQQCSGLLSPYSACCDNRCETEAADLDTGLCLDSKLTL
jgi:hypothetical protein